MPPQPWTLAVQRAPQSAAHADEAFVDLVVEAKTLRNEHITISYPVLHHPNPTVAAALAELVTPDATLPENSCGTIEWIVVGANTGLVSLLHTSFVDACFDAERVEGVGGARGGADVSATVYQIDGNTMAPVSFTEIMASPRHAKAALQQYCETEVAAPDTNVTRHAGACYCDGIDRIDSDGSQWSFGVDPNAVHFYQSGSGCDLIVPYVSVKPWLAPSSPLLRVLRAPEAED